MIVLATGMNPSMSGEKLPVDISQDSYGFFVDNSAPNDGIFSVGCSKTPADVSACIKEANSVALKAIGLVLLFFGLHIALIV